MRLQSAERLLFGLIGPVWLVNLTLIVFLRPAIDIEAYVAMASIGAVALGVGQFYRFVRPNERLASALTAAGIFVQFTLAASLLNYLLLPVGDRRIDGHLMSIDAQLGYRWSDLVEWVAAYPAFAQLLRVVYLSSLVQMVFVIVLLGFTGRFVKLAQFQLTGIIAGLCTILFWFMLPSSGPSAYQSLGADVVAQAGLVVGPAYGAELNRLMLEGPSLVSPRETLGLIAFPSFHTVMACLSVFFLSGYRHLFKVAVAVNLLMVPSILIHGGHHLVDLIGGVTVFAIALIAARCLLPNSTGQLSERAVVGNAAATNAAGSSNS